MSSPTESSNLGGSLRDGYRRMKATLEPLRPVYDAWMKVIAAFSWVLARVVLTLLFFTAFATYGVLIRLTRRDPMRRRIDPDRDSYWEDNAVNNADLDDFKTQY